MSLTPSGRGLLALLAIQLVVFVVSLPGLGIETRTFTQYATWARPVFLVLTVLVFALGVASLATLWRGPRTAASLAVGMGIVALATVLLDLSGVGGPAPPTGPLVLSAIAIIVAGFLFVLAARLRSETKQGPGPTSVPGGVAPPETP